MLSEVFLSFLISSCIACILAIGNQLYRSKCDKVEICCIKVHRNVDIETDVEIPKIELPTLRTQSLDRKTIFKK
jgi:hypothetical protein